VFPQTRADVVAFAETATFPVRLKPDREPHAQRRSDMRMVKAEDARTLVRHYDQMETPGCPNYMIQEYIPGGPDMVWMFDGYFDEGSRCLFGMTGKKLRQYPAYTGVTSPRHLHRERDGLAADDGVHARHRLPRRARPRL
jgi:predicted ATP-grasp superfamily ATP-dependent carboligase